MDASDAAGAPASRRTRLRQYQEQLLERMQAARTSSGARAHQLGVEIGGQRYLLELLDAGEIVPVPALTAVPLTRPWYLGLANIRGGLVGVVDLGLYFGEREAEAEAPAGTATASASGTARLVTFAPALGMPCALLATRVYGLRHAADMQPEDAHLRDADGVVWTPLALAALVKEERFLQVGL
jgi:twitching motility protein PilI